MNRIGIFTLVILALFGTSASGQACLEGQEIRRNNMFYVCRSGAQVPIACSTVDGIRVNPGNEYRTSQNLFTCQHPTSQTFALVATACIRNGEVVHIGATLAEENYWYTCQREPDGSISLKPSGCIGEQGTRVGPNGIVTKKSFLFRCSFVGNAVGLEPYGCIVDNSHYPAGQDIISQNFWYQCNLLPSGGGLELKLSGCVENGQKLYNGSTVVRQNFLFRCDITSETARFAAIGCLDDSRGHHLIGETWREQSQPSGASGSGGLLSFEMECKRENNQIVKSFKSCYFQSTSSGEGPISPNCVRRFGTNLVKCIQGDRVRAEVIPNASDQQFRDAINAGFRQC